MKEFGPEVQVDAILQKEYSRWRKIISDGIKESGIGVEISITGPRRDKIFEKMAEELKPRGLGLQERDSGSFIVSEGNSSMILTLSNRRRETTKNLEKEEALFCTIAVLFVIFYLSLRIVISVLIPGSDIFIRIACIITAACLYSSICTSLFLKRISLDLERIK